MRRRMLLAILLLATNSAIAFSQEREVELLRPPPQLGPAQPRSPSTTPGTYRDPVSSAIDAAHESVDQMATTKVEKFSRWDRAGFTERARKVQYQQQTKLVKGAGELAGNNYFKTLGWVSTLSDGGATIAGRLREKDLSGAAVALLDESAQATAATGGAWALGKLGAGLGLTFGGPPGMMIGGAVGGIVGGVLATVGYNAYLSDSVSAVGDAAVAPVQSDHHDRDVALKNRIEWLVENGYPIPAILLEQEWAERDRQIRTPDTQPPPVFVVGPSDEPQVPASPPSTVASVSTSTPADAAPPGPVWLYHGVWLPEKYLPSGFRHYDSDARPQGDPPRSNGSQSVWYDLPLQKKGGRGSSSAGEHPYTVYIDSMMIFKSVALAEEHVQTMRASLSAKTSVPLGDEAYIADNCKGDDGSIFKEYTGRNGVWMRSLLLYLVRVGRVTFGLRVSGDRVMDFNPNGSDHRDFVAYETPSQDQIMQVATSFVDAVRRYANDKGWLRD